MARAHWACALLLLGCGGHSSPHPRSDGASIPSTSEPPAQIAPLLDLFGQRPHDRVLAYVIARAYDNVGDTTRVLQWLKTLENLGFDDALEPADFVHSQASFDFAQVQAGFARRALTKTTSDVAFSIDEPDLLPEGVAYDAVRGEFFVSSGAKRKIIAVARDGRARDFVAPEIGGIYAVLGLEVDEERRALWAASAAAPFMAHATEQDAGRSAVFEFDADTGALRGRYDLPHSPSLANDLALASDGTVYVTDSIRGTISRIEPGSPAVQELVPVESFEGPNGLAMTPDGEGLLVADMLGISHVDRITGAVRRLNAPDTRYPLGGIDGLISAPLGLIAIQNLCGRGRVLYLYLTPDGEITSVALLESNHPAYENPTTGELGADGFYYLANPHYQGSGRGPLTPAADRKLLMLRLPLP